MLDLLLPRRCLLCATVGTALCPDCTRTLPPAPDRAPPPGLDECHSLLLYEGPARALVAQLKFHGRRDAFEVLGAAMVELLEHPSGTVTWAPTSAARRRRRGYDQARLLAESAARGAGLPCRDLLRRAGGGPQTGLDRAGRLDGPRFDARCRPPPAVVLVDDVRTTGSTLCAAADALIAAGARSVIGLTLAITP